MANKHPYVAAPGGLEKAIDHFRKSFPSVVDSSTLKKLGFAPNNESYVLNVLRFLKFIDTENQRTDLAAQIFSNHDDTAFFESFSSAVQAAYSDLFELHGEEAWVAERDALITYFRKTDRTTSVVGTRQASTFLLLARLSGRREKKTNQKFKTRKPSVTTPAKGKKKSKLDTSPASDASTDTSLPTIDGATPKVGLTVRIEINLPAVNDKETYDKIFKSIRENLLNE